MHYVRSSLLRDRSSRATSTLRTFRSVHKFSGDSSLIRSTVVFHPIPATCVPNQRWHGPGKQFSGWNCNFPQYDPYLYCGAISSPTRASQNIYLWYIALGKISFLSLTLLLPSFGIRMPDIQAFHYHKTHKNNSNHFAVWARVYMLRTAYIAESCGQSTSHSCSVNTGSDVRRRVSTPHRRQK